MTLQEVAEYLRLSEDVVYPLARKGELPGFKIGKQWRFRRSEIDAWLESKRLDDSSKRPD
ncbi:MAG: helix-turn-helix domain-containing protein [Planctomycetales bacterium]|nr:helix-turn-helix domain-containing protein [Planctomycetales bacterium]